MKKRTVTRLFAGMLGMAMLMSSGIGVYAEEDAAVVEADNEDGETVTITCGVWADDEAEPSGSGVFRNGR